MLKRATRRIGRRQNRAVIRVAGRNRAEADSPSIQGWKKE